MTCIEIDDLVDNLSIVDSQDEVLDVYILTDASLSDNESFPDTCQKMNICSDFSDPGNETDLHFSEEFSSDDYTDETSEYISNDTLSIVPSLSTDRGTKNSQPVLNSLPPQSTMNSFCPYPKIVSQSSSSLPVPTFFNINEISFVKKIVKTNNLLYILVEVQVKGEWITVDAFIDTGGSNNLAHPSLFKGLWKPLQNILISETIGGSVNLTHYFDNVSLKIGGSIVKISAIQHYDASTSLFLGMQFINSMLTITISDDKVILNIKKKAISVPRLTLANSEARKENSQKKAQQAS